MFSHTDLIYRGLDYNHTYSKHLRCCQSGCIAPKLLTLSSLNVTSVSISDIAAFCVRTVSVTPDGLPRYCRDHHRTGLYMRKYRNKIEGKNWPMKTSYFWPCISNSWSNMILLRCHDKMCYEILAYMYSLSGQNTISVNAVL